ncbi:MAG: ABC transporter ATP-binding protein [Burkholderiaceae bacterium]
MSSKIVSSFVFGLSGCGKSTSLEYDRGLVILVRIVTDDDQMNVAVPAHRRDVAMVFQSYAPLSAQICLREHRFRFANAQVSEVADRRPRPRCGAPIDIDNLPLDRRPNQLSRGQRQRVALGRAMVRQPAVFLMDEPLSNLDAALRVSMRAEIKQLHQSMNCTFVYVTHDQAEALTLADRVVVMRHGLVQQIGPPEQIYERPANVNTASFLGNPGDQLPVRCA